MATEKIEYLAASENQTTIVDFTLHEAFNDTQRIESYPSNDTVIWETPLGLD